MKLPKGWINTELGKVCKLKNGFAFKSTEYKEYGVPVVRISDINNEIISVVNSVKVNERDIYENYLVEKDDILIAMSGATTGKFGIYKDSEKAYQNQRVGNFKILNKDLLCNNFLFYCIYNLKRQIEKDAYGGAQPNISSTKIENLEIPLPPLSEQHRIVAKIEELFSELDNGIEQLKKAKQQIKTYRQAVLKAAFEGKLTNKNVIDGELPEGWELSKIKDCLFLKKDKHKPEKTQKLFYIGLEHIEKDLGQLNIDYIKSNINTVKNKFNKGDLLYGKLRPYLNKVYLAKNDGVCSTDILVFKPIELINMEYFKFYFLSNRFVNDMSANCSGINLPRVPTEYILNYIVPLPKLKEQNKIVSEIEQRFSVADKLDESINKSLQQAETLRQSILKKAFEGKLVPQDPKDEPAEKLLERIKTP